MGEVQRKLNQIKINTFEGQFRGKYLEKVRHEVGLLAIKCDKACELWGTGVAGAGWGGSPPIYTWHSTHTHTHSHALHRRLRKPPAAPQHPQTLICTCPGGK